MNPNAALHTCATLSSTMIDSMDFEPSASSGATEGAHGFEAHAILLKNQLEEQQLRNRELERCLSLMDERLDTEVQKREIADLNRQILIDTLMERTEELRLREATIEEQNCLLSLAWTDVQELNAARQETEKTIELLRDYVEHVLGSDGTDGVGGNKRRRTCS